MEKVLPLFYRRNGSSPGINMIPYKVYKKCPQTVSFLLTIFQSILKLTTLPLNWRVASEIYIPKINPPNPESIDEFWPIALLNVEGRLFFSLLWKPLEDHIVKKNKLIDLFLQKDCMSKVSGCWEHVSSLERDESCKSK